MRNLPSIQQELNPLLDRLENEDFSLPSQLQLDVIWRLERNIASLVSFDNTDKTTQYLTPELCNRLENLILNSNNISRTKKRLLVHTLGSDVKAPRDFLMALYSQYKLDKETLIPFWNNPAFLRAFAEQNGLDPELPIDWLREVLH